jgi:hypothetical protein
MTTSLVRKRHHLFLTLLAAPAVPACEHVAAGEPVLFCALHGGPEGCGLMCERCLGEHLAVRHYDLTCDHCGAESVLAHWRPVLVIDIIRIRPPADDVALLATPAINVAWSSSCAIHEAETCGDVDALGLATPE